MNPVKTNKLPLDDLIGNIESKVLILTFVCGSLALKGNDGYRGIDLINAVDMLHAEILDGLNTIKKPYNTM